MIVKTLTEIVLQTQISGAEISNLNSVIVFDGKTSEL